MKTVFCLLFLALFAASEAKVFTKCELAKALKTAGLDGYYGYSLANCTEHTKEKSSSTDYNDYLRQQGTMGYVVIRNGKETAEGKLQSVHRVQGVVERSGQQTGNSHNMKGDFSRMCMAYYESRYTTNALYDNGWSRDYGIFQINSYWWCNDGKTSGAVAACSISCNSLMNDDITDDINCAKRVVRDPNGMGAWVAWNNNCKNKDVSSFVSGCAL